MADDRRPNILWYCTDQQRYDTIGALGNPHVRTPVLDGLVESGVAFTNAYTQCPICTPSRATFLTGRYPATHHVHRNGNDRNATTPDQPVRAFVHRSARFYHRPIPAATSTFRGPQPGLSERGPAPILNKLKY